MNIARFGDGSMLFHLKGHRERQVVLEDVGGETVIVGFGSPTTAFEDHASEAQKVIDTVRWRER